MHPPLERLWPVDPTGVAIMIPSAADAEITSWSTITLKSIGFKRSTEVIKISLIAEP